jgi:hypothetical protein
VIELYAITDDPVPSLPTLEPLSTLSTGSLAAVCGAASGNELSAEALWRREEILETLMASCDLLPARYGTRFDDVSAAAHALERRHDTLAAALDRVRGAVELSVRALDSAEPDPPHAPASGTEYLRGEANRCAAHERAARAVHEPLCALARESVRRTPRRPRERLTAAYLVDRDRVGDFAHHVARLQGELPDLSLLCTGPWPPYSFAEL